MFEVTATTRNPVSLTTDSASAPAVLTALHDDDGSSVGSGESTERPVIRNPFIIMERELNKLDHIFLISLISGVARILMAVVQFFVAIIDAIMEATSNENVFGEKENHFKHAGLNLLRGFVALIPLGGSAALRVRDIELKVRVAYDHEILEDEPETTDYTNMAAAGNAVQEVAKTGRFLLGAGAAL